MKAKQVISSPLAPSPSTPVSSRIGKSTDRRPTAIQISIGSRGFLRPKQTPTISLPPSPNLEAVLSLVHAHGYIDPRILPGGQQFLPLSTPSCRFKSISLVLQSEHFILRRCSPMKHWSACIYCRPPERASISSGRTASSKVE